MQIFMQQQEQLQAIQSQAEGTTEPCDVENQRSRTQMTPMNQELDREPNNNNPESLSASLQSESRIFVTFGHTSIFFSFTWYGVTKKNYGNAIHLLKHEINVSKYSRLCACAFAIMHLI